MTQKSKSRNADFKSIARRAIRHLQRRRRCRPLSEANTTCRRQAATTLGAKPRQPSPLNPLNPLNPRAKGPSLNPHAEGVSKGASNSLLRISLFFSTIKRKQA